MNGNINIDVNKLNEMKNTLITIISELEQTANDVQTICISNYYQSGEAMNLFNMYSTILGKIPSITMYYYKLCQYIEITRAGIENTDMNLTEMIKGRPLY